VKAGNVASNRSVIGKASFKDRVWEVSSMDVYGPRPIATGWLDLAYWSQLLTYIRLHDAVGQRLRREPRWVFARFHLKALATLADAMPVHRPGSGSDGVTVSPSPAVLLQLVGWTSFSLSAASLQAAFTDRAGS
jgi:hypothetical protein